MANITTKVLTAEQGYYDDPPSVKMQSLGEMSSYELQQHLVHTLVCAGQRLNKVDWPTVVTNIAACIPAEHKKQLGSALGFTEAVSVVEAELIEPENILYLSMPGYSLRRLDINSTNDMRYVMQIIKESDASRVNLLCPVKLKKEHPVMKAIEKAKREQAKKKADAEKKKMERAIAKAKKLLESAGVDVTTK